MFKKIFIFFIFSFFLVVTSDVFAGCNGPYESVICYPWSWDNNCHCYDQNDDNNTFCFQSEILSYGCNSDFDGSYLVRLKQYYCDLGDHSPCSGSSCFLPDTQIATSGGYASIQDIQSGQEIESYDSNPDISNESKKVTTTKVEKLLTHQKDSYYELKTSDGKIVKATAEHPFLIDEGHNINLINKVFNFLNQGWIYLQNGWYDIFK